MRKPSTASAWPVTDEVADLGEREAVVGEAARLDRAQHADDAAADRVARRP